VRVSTSVWVCVSVREGGFVYTRYIAILIIMFVWVYVFPYVYMSVCLCVCTCAWMRVCMCVSACACVRVRVLQQEVLEKAKLITELRTDDGFLVTGKTLCSAVCWSAWY